MKITLAVICLVLSGCDQLKPTSPAFPNPNIGRYQVIGDANSNGHAWKLDTATGELWMCAIGVDSRVGGDDRVLCHPAYLKP